MKDWTSERVAEAAEARLIVPLPDVPRAEPDPRGREGKRPGLERVVIDSREAGPGALFVGLPGANVDGGRFAAAALASGACTPAPRRERPRGSSSSRSGRSHRCSISHAPGVASSGRRSSE
jgi:UDP-N-acetylmuramoyl-tripeptide--D-alanyl-D-alanine ligase